MILPSPSILGRTSASPNTALEPYPAFHWRIPSAMSCHISRSASLLLLILTAFSLGLGFQILTPSDAFGQSETPAVSPMPEQGLDAAIDLARRTLTYVETSRELPELAAELSELEARSAAIDGASGAAELETEVRALRRRIILAHPALDFKTMLINKNPPTLYSHNCDQYLGRHSQQGAGLVLLSDWKTDAPEETVLLADKMPLGAYNKPKLHWDGDRIVFAFCDHTESDASRRRYFLWECAADGSWTRQLTGTAEDVLAGWGDRETALIEDNDPCYLPDGGIAFVSTRCQGFGRCHNGRYTPALLLYRCDGDGRLLRQLSWGEANETDPIVLNDGRIAYTRWEYVNRNVTKFHMLWTTRPDGTGSANLYGNLTEAPWMLSETAPIPGTSSFYALATGHHTYSTGCVVRISPEEGENYEAPIERITPEIPWFESEKVDRNGCFSTPFPLNEELCLASYTPKRIPSQGRHNINDYAIYLIDSLGGRERIYADPNVSCFSPTPLVARQTPPELSPMVDEAIFAVDTASEIPATATLTLQDVYISAHDPEGLIQRGDIVSLRINEIINQPVVLKNNGAQPSMVRHDCPKKTLGTVPVLEDGSANFIVPSMTPIQLQALDAEGKAVLTMRSFVYLQPGEARSCIGCHEPSGTAPSARPPMAAMRPPVEIESVEGIEYASGFSYPRTVQPVLDRYCIDCHGLSDNPAQHANLDLTGVLEPHQLPNGLMASNTGLVPRSYNALFNLGAPEMLGIAIFKSETNESVACDYFAAASGLYEMLSEGHAGVKLDPDSMQRVVNWLDLNSQCYGDFSWNRIEARRADPDGETALRVAIEERFGPKIASLPFETLVNAGRPDQSRVLKAALSDTSGGWAQWTPSFTGTDDPAYQDLERLVNASIAPLPYEDIAGTCGRGDKCICRSCWVHEAEVEFREELTRLQSASE